MLSLTPFSRQKKRPLPSMGPCSRQGWRFFRGGDVRSGNWRDRVPSWKQVLLAGMTNSGYPHRKKSIYHSRSIINVRSRTYPKPIKMIFAQKNVTTGLFNHAGDLTSWSLVVPSLSLRAWNDFHIRDATTYWRRSQASPAIMNTPGRNSSRGTVGLLSAPPLKIHIVASPAYPSSRVISLDLTAYS